MDIAFLYFDGHSYREIQEEYNVSRRQIDNSLKYVYEAYDFQDEDRKIVALAHRQQNIVSKEQAIELLGWKSGNYDHYQVSSITPEDYIELYGEEAFEKQYMPFILKGI